VLQFPQTKNETESPNHRWSPMYGVRPQLVTSLLAAHLCFSLVSSASATQGRKPHKAAPVQVVPQPAPPPEPLVPLTLQQMPATPPEVTYSQGKLTIVAQNATLRDILHAVHDQTGANMDVPANATERVVGQMGPGSPRDVLAQLLNGSSFNYVILGSATDPNKVERVILSSKPAASQENAAQAPANAAPPTEQPGSGFGFNQQPASDDEDDSSEMPADGNSAQPAQAPVRTPEQLLQELQRQQQQAQQQQGQQQQGQQQQGQQQQGPPPQTQPASPPDRH
jgi:hypothetical protein